MKRLVPHKKFIKKIKRNFPCSKMHIGASSSFFVVKKNAQMIFHSPTCPRIDAQGHFHTLLNTLLIGEEFRIGGVS